MNGTYKDDAGTTEIKWNGNTAVIKNSNGITITMTLYDKETNTEFKANTKIIKDTELEYKVSYDFGF